MSENTKKFDGSNQLQHELRMVIYRHAENADLSLAQVVGVLELVKLNFIREQREEREDEE